MSYFDLNNAWYSFLAQNPQPPHVQLVMFHFIQQNNINRNRGSFVLTDRELRQLTCLSPNRISDAKRRLVELGFIQIDADKAAPRKPSTYFLITKPVTKLVTKPVTKPVTNENFPIYARARKTYKKLRSKEKESKEKERVEVEVLETANPSEPDWEQALLDFQSRTEEPKAQPSTPEVELVKEEPSKTDNQPSTPEVELVKEEPSTSTQENRAVKAIPAEGRVHSTAGYKPPEDKTAQRAVEMAEEPDWEKYLDRRAPPLKGAQDVEFTGDVSRTA